jgi:hypothetical protein
MTRTYLLPLREVTGNRPVASEWFLFVISTTREYVTPPGVDGALILGGVVATFVDRYPWRCWSRYPYVFPAEPAAELDSVPAAPWQTWRYHEDIRIQTTIDLNISLEWMITRLQQQFGTVSSKQLEAYERSLTQPKIVGEPLLPFLTRHSDVHLTCEGHGQPMSEANKVRTLLNSLVPSGRFGSFIESYNLRYRTMAQQNFDNAREELIDYESTLDVSATSKSLGFAAPAVDIQVLIAAAVKEAFLAEKTAKSTATRKASPQQPNFYCWTQGLNYTHDSDKCRKQANGHSITVTINDKQGGSTNVLSKPKRRHGT